MSYFTHKSPFQLVGICSVALLGAAATLCGASAIGMMVISAIFGSGDLLLPPQYGVDAGWLLLSSCASLAVFDGLRSRGLRAKLAIVPSRPMRSIFLLASSPLFLALDRLAILTDDASLWGYANPPSEDRWIFIPKTPDESPHSVFSLAKAMVIRIPIWSLMSFLIMGSAVLSFALCGPVLLELFIVRLVDRFKQWRRPCSAPAKR